MTIGIDSHRPLTTNEKGLLIAGSTLAGGPLAIATRGSKLALWLWKIRPATIPFLFPSTDSPGGGGPGHSPTSTDTPLSLAEQGRAMAEAGKYGRTPSPSVGKESRASGGSRRRCPSGYRWNGRRCVKR